MNIENKIIELIKELGFEFKTKFKAVLKKDDDTTYEVFLGHSVGCFLKIHKLKLICLSGTSQSYTVLYNAILKELTHEIRKKKIKDILK